MKEIESQGTYSHVFVYRISKRNHKALLNLQERLRGIYKKHGMLGSKIYQLGQSNVFEGFDSFEKSLGAKDDEEVWIEIDTYESAKEFARIVAAIGQDTEAGPMWGELAQLTFDHPVIMGEFELLTRM